LEESHSPEKLSESGLNYESNVNSTRNSKEYISPARLVNIKESDVCLEASFSMQGISRSDKSITKNETNINNFALAKPKLNFSGIASTGQSPICSSRLA
jgi:hypothetical protein